MGQDRVAGAIQTTAVQPSQKGVFYWSEGDILVSFRLEDYVGATKSSWDCITVQFVEGYMKVTNFKDLAQMQRFLQAIGNAIEGN